MRRMLKLPLKVLQYGLSAAEDAGGVETYLISQFRNMPRDIARYDFISRNGDREMAFEKEILSAGSEIYKVTSRHESARRHYVELVRLFWRIRGRYDVLVVNASTLTYGSLVLLGCLARIPIRIYHSHACDDNHPMSRAYRVKCLIDRLIIRYFVTHRFACSGNAGAWMFGSQAKYTVIPNAIESGKFTFSSKTRMEMRERLGVQDDFVLGMVGNIDPQKNHLFALDILSAVRRQIPNAKMIFVGGAPNSDGLGLLARIRERISDLGLENSVLILGRRVDIPDLLSAMDLFLMPSVSEGFGIAAVEAQLSGLPCLLSTGMPKDVSITSQTRFLSLTAGIDIWANAVTEMRKERQGYDAAFFKTTKYDVRNSAEIMKNVYGTFLKL